MRSSATRAGDLKLRTPSVIALAARRDIERSRDGGVRRERKAQICG